MKFLYACTLLLAAFAASQASSATWGYRNSSDFLLFKSIEGRSPVRNDYTSVNVDFPRAGLTNVYTIAAVVVTDNFRNSSGATPSLWSGGPGYRSVTINLKSQFNQGMNSTVEIWGR